MGMREDRSRVRHGLTVAVEDVARANTRAGLVDVFAMLTGSVAAGAMIVRRWCDDDETDTPTIIDPHGATIAMATSLFAMLTSAAEDVARAKTSREIGMAMAILTDDIARMVETYTV